MPVWKHLPLLGDSVYSQRQGRFAHLSFFYESCLQGQNLGAVSEEFGTICGYLSCHDVEISDLPGTNVVDDLSQAIAEFVRRGAVVWFGSQINKDLVICKSDEP